MLFRRVFRGALIGVGASRAFSQATRAEPSANAQRCQRDQQNEHECRLHGHTLIPFTVPGPSASYAGKPGRVKMFLCKKLNITNFMMIIHDFSSPVNRFY